MYKKFLKTQKIPGKAAVCLSKYSAEKKKHKSEIFLIQNNTTKFNTYYIYFTYFLKNVKNMDKVVTLYLV